MKKRSKKFLVFSTSEEQFAMSIEKIIMIEKVDYHAESKNDVRVTKVNSYPDYIEGVILYKNQVIPVIEFEYLLTKKNVTRHDENKIIFIKGKEQDFGILVDDVKSIIELNSTTFQKAFKESPLYMTEKDGEIYIVPDMDEILGIDEIFRVFNDFRNFNTEDDAKEN